MFRSLFTAKGRVGKSAATYYSAGSYTFTVPANVYYISAVCVGGGGGGTGSQASSPGAGAGGDMVHATLPVTPGEALTVVVGDGGIRGEYRGNPGGHGESSGIKRGSTFILKAKGGKGGGNSTAQESNVIDDDATRSGENTGGAGGPSGPSGGGGAAGYSGSGGNGGGGVQNDGYDGSGGGGGGGAYNIYVNGIGGSGGGVYLLGEGTSGYGADDDQFSSTFLVGGPGSGDASGTTVYQKNVAGHQPVGAGGGSAAEYQNTGQGGIAGDHGGVRIVWPGQTSFFPSTDVG